MDFEALVILFLIIIAFVWGFWLIFKRDLMQNQVGKLLSYFLGVILTLIIVLGMVSWFLPWWATKLMQNTRNSSHVQAFQRESIDLWNDLSDGDIIVTSEPIQPPDNLRPQPTTSPLAAPGSQGQTVPGCGARIHTIAPKDTLYAISNKYGTTVVALKQCNGLTTDTIYIGQQLVVP